MARAAILFLRRAARSAHVSTNRFAGTGHILIVGWSASTPVVLEEFTETELARGKKVVILSPRDRDEIERATAAAIGRRKLDLVAVGGDPTNPADLERASPGSASAILVNAWDGERGDEEALAATRALLGLSGPSAIAVPVVVLVHGEGSCQEIRRTGGTRVVPICLSLFMPRIVAQVCRQRGALAAYRELLSFRGNDIYLADGGRLAGATYGRSLRAFENACVIGISYGDRCVINPPMGTVIAKDDAIVVVAENQEGITASPPLLPAPRIDDIASETFETGRGESFLILGWNERGVSILRSLSQFAGKDSTVRIIAPRPIPPLPPFARDLTVTVDEGSIEDPEALAALPFEYYEHILVLGEDRDGDPARLRVLAALEAALSARGFQNHVSVELAFSPPGSGVPPDERFAVTFEIVFRLLAQLCIHPEVHRVVEALINPTGSELYVKPVENYVKISRTVDFYTIIEAARRRGETAVGYYLAGGPANRGDEGIVLNPKKDERREFHHLDGVIVLAEEA